MLCMGAPIIASFCLFCLGPAKMAYTGEALDGAICTAAREMGYSKLRANQEKVVKTFLRCRDVFVSLLTGSGKSLCYCILPLVFDKLRRRRGTDSRSIAVVVSPLRKTR